MKRRIMSISLSVAMLASLPISYISANDSGVVLASENTDNSLEKCVKEEDYKEYEINMTNADKVYNVPIKLEKFMGNGAPSMGNGALEPIAQVVERDGKSETYITLKGLRFMNMYGHLLKMWQAPKGQEPNVPYTELIPVEIVHKKIDQGLKEKGCFPRVFKIVRPDLKEDAIGVRVEVDAMEEIASSTGQANGHQPAILKFDWERAEDITPAPTPDPDPAPTPDPDPDPAPTPDPDPTPTPDPTNPKPRPTRPSRPSKPGTPSISNPEKSYNEDVVYIDGYQDDTFKPEKSIKRAEMAKILAIALTDGFDSKVDYPNNFKDVNEKAWYKKIVSYMKELDLVEGYGDGKFNPDKPITRAEVAKIVAKIENIKEIDKDEFKDVSKKHWAKGYIEALKEKKYIKGYPDGEFKAENEITRAEAVTIVNRIVKKDVNKYKDKKGLKQFEDVPKEHWAYLEIIAATNKLK